ncbi:MAG: ABC transporter permease [Spirochaetia bacterium]|jgi:ABC-type nitrate/sulfonate/bicarbonate transport system permease component|nr:ABC transporter permease [Spirochaetia bacterium]
MNAFFRQTIFIIFLIAAWFFFSESGLVNSYLVPSPIKIFEAGIEMVSNGKLQANILISIVRVVYGFCITAIIAMPLAFIFYLFPLLYSYFSGFLAFLKSIPPLATVPLLILWFGIDEASKIALIFLASFFPIFLDTFNGLAQVDKKILEMGDTLELTHFEKIYHILIPEALPSIITGLRLGFAYCWRALIGAEMIAAASGLGYMILDAEEMARIDIVYLGIISIGVFGLVIEHTILKWVNRIFPWMNFECKAK